jgi:hypothetical protein
MVKASNGSLGNTIGDKDLRRALLQLLEQDDWTAKQLTNGHVMITAPNGARHTLAGTARAPVYSLRGLRSFIRNNSDLDGIAGIRRRSEMAKTRGRAPVPKSFQAPTLSEDSLARILACLRTELGAANADRVNLVLSAVRHQVAVEPACLLTPRPIEKGGVWSPAPIPRDQSLVQRTAQALCALLAVQRRGADRAETVRFSARQHAVDAKVRQPWRVIVEYCHAWYRHWGSHQRDGNRDVWAYSGRVREPVGALFAVLIALDHTTADAAADHKPNAGQCTTVVRHVTNTLRAYGALENLDMRSEIRVFDLDWERTPVETGAPAYTLWLGALPQKAAERAERQRSPQLVRAAIEATVPMPDIAGPPPSSGDTDRGEAGDGHLPEPPHVGSQPVDTVLDGLLSVAAQVESLLAERDRLRLEADQAKTEVRLAKAEAEQARREADDVRNASDGSGVSAADLAAAVQAAREEERSKAQKMISKLMSA